MRRCLTGAGLFGMALALTSPMVAQASAPRNAATARGQAAERQPRSPSPIALEVSAGYQGLYRGTAWTPVRVTLHNRSSADVRGTVEIPENSESASVAASPNFHGLYEAPIVVPAEGAAHVTLYVPGSGVQGQVNARFLQGGRTLVSATTYPTGVDSSALLIGVMASGPADSAWIAPAIQSEVTTHLIQLSPATLDPVAGALETFDVIVLTDVDTSQLDSAQMSALRGYVQSGGSLLLVGGPTWQQTLRPLAPALVPGRVTGMRLLPNLDALLPLGSLSRPRGAQTAAVSVLARPSGTILARQSGVPLIIRKSEGQGVIEYLAFDPSLDPVQSWRGAPRLLQHLIALAAPVAITRTWSPGGVRRRFTTAFSAQALTDELANLPPARLPLLTIFAALTLAYVFILGPANFLVLRRLGRPGLAWVTTRVLAFVFLGSAGGVSAHLNGSMTQLNSLGVIPLVGGQGASAATFYLGLEAPLSGDYRLTYSGDSLVTPDPSLNLSGDAFWRNATTLHATPLGVRMQQGTPTEIDFPSMKQWSMRDVTLNTAVRIPGAITSRLAIGPSGDIAGAIHNGTGLDLLDPVLVAGQSVARLSELKAGATVPARIRPSDESSDQGPSTLFSQLYGGAGVQTGFGGFGGFGDCCDQASFQQEATLNDRVRNAVGMLSQLQPQLLSSLGNVLVVGWTEQPFGSFSVNGSAPQQRDLTMIVAPLSVRLPAQGSFQLLPGTISAQLVDVTPRAPAASNSFGFFDRHVQPVVIGVGGSLTFAFDLPGGRHVRFRQLVLNVDFDGNVTNSSGVYDWRTNRWERVDLSNNAVQLRNPDRLVSPSGQLLLRIWATPTSGDLTIDDPQTDIQLSGAGSAT